MKKFEYFKFNVIYTKDGSIIYYGDDQYDGSRLIEIMDELGYEGWELVSTIALTESYKPWFLEMSMTYTGGVEYYFKRELSEEEIEKKITIDDIIEEYTELGYQITFQHPQRIIFNKGVEDVRFDFDKNARTWIKHP